MKETQPRQTPGLFCHPIAAVPQPQGRLVVVEQGWLRTPTLAKGFPSLSPGTIVSGLLFLTVVWSKSEAMLARQGEAPLAQRGASPVPRRNL